MSGRVGGRVGGRSGGRVGGRAGTVLLALVAAALLLVVTTRPWLVAQLPPGPGERSGRPLDVPGSTASALVPALGLVGLAGAAALSTLRGPGRVLAALLLVLAGAGAVAAAVVVLAGPSAAAADAVRSATGTSGSGAAPARATAWASVALVPALGLCAAGAGALLRGRRWGTSARFEAPSAAAGRATSPAALWDGLSAGDDPTTGAGAAEGQRAGWRPRPAAPRESDEQPPRPDEPGGHRGPQARDR